MGTKTTGRVLENLFIRCEYFPLTTVVLV